MWLDSPSSAPSRNIKHQLLRLIQPRQKGQESPGEGELQADASTMASAALALQTQLTSSGEPRQALSAWQAAGMGTSAEKIKAAFAVGGVADNRTYPSLELDAAAAGECDRSSLGMALQWPVRRFLAEAVPFTAPAFESVKQEIFCSTAGAVQLFESRYGAPHCSSLRSPVLRPRDLAAVSPLASVLPAAPAGLGQTPRCC